MNGRLFAGSCCVLLLAASIFVAQSQSGPANGDFVDGEITFASGEVEAAAIVVDSAPALLDPLLASHVLTEPDDREVPEFVAQLAQAETDSNPVEPERAKPFAVDAPAVPANVEVTYDGRPFDHWKSLLLNELKPELRIEAVHAVHRFGMNGRPAEAAEAMLTVLDGYSARIWAELAVGDLEVAMTVAMEGQYEGLSTDGLLIANAIFALFEMSPSAVEQLESHSRQPWTGIGPMVAVRFLSEAAPERAIPILCDQIRQEANELQAEVAFDRLKALRHNPAAVAGAIAIATDQPRWRYAVLAMFEDVPFTPESVRFILETLRSGTSSEPLATALSTSGLLQTLADEGELKTPGVSVEDFLIPELLPVLQTIVDYRSHRIRYLEPAVKVLVKVAPNPVETLKLLIERRQENDPVRETAEAALRRLADENLP